MGHDVTVVAYGDPGADDLITIHPPFSASCAEVSIRLIGKRSRLERLYPRKARKELTPLIEASDVVHLHGCWESMLPAAASLANHFKKRRIVTPHGMVADYGMSRGTFKKRLALTCIGRTLYGGPTAVQVLTEIEATQLSKYIPYAQTVTIPNAVDLDAFLDLPAASMFREIVPNLGTSPYVLFLARLDYMKGLDRLIGAFALLARKFPEMHLVVAGPDYGVQRASEQYARETGFSERIHFVGELSGSIKLAALVGATCLCQPSRHEGFSISVIEAMACGTPVVVSNEMDIPGLTSSGAGLLTDADPESIADGIEKFASNPDRRRRASQAAVSLIRQRYDWKKIANQFLDLYRGVSLGEN